MQRQTEYEQALAIRPESTVEEKLETVRLMCQGPSETATITGETPTPSTTPTGPVATATATQPMVDTPTATQSSTSHGDLADSHQPAMKHRPPPNLKQHPTRRRQPKKQEFYSRKPQACLGC